LTLRFTCAAFVPLDPWSRMKQAMGKWRDV
jgi:hypothetical protein